MEQPRPEYPRPQCTRPDWLNLNGKWEFAFDPNLSGIGRGLAHADRLADEIIVPFCPESSLSGIGDVDFHPGVWYRREIDVPAAWEGRRVLLHFGAVDHDATVWVNGQQAATHIGGYTPFSCDITPLLARGGNVVTVFAQDDNRSPLTATGKQSPQYASYGCVYTRTTGIWQTVWLEAVPQTYIGGLRLTPDLEGGRLIVEATVSGSPTRGTLKARATLEGQPVGEAQNAFVGQQARLVLPLREVQTWAPGHPTLYDLELTLEAQNGSRDQVGSYFGMRSLALTDRAILLNGAPVYQRLVLDQGFYPDGIYTAPTDEALRNDVVISQGLGFNGARLHEKVFEPRFLYWADRLGYLVWGEFPNWGMDISRPEALAYMLPQWLEALRRDYSHPSIVGWCPFNETQRDQDPRVVHGIYQATKAIDHTRPVIDTSGYVHVETDIYDVHDYNQDPETFAARYNAFGEGGEPFRNFPQVDAPYGGQPYFVSEYGGIWWNPGQEDTQGWGYGGVEGRPRSPQEFLARYRALTETLLRHPRMCAFCYTQLYDIEQEVNGLYTYGRRAKFDPRDIHAINTQKAAIEE
ncbi:MAG: beta-galactosidase [Chloroflexi bacterium]|nr:beta-galactosidase [Chloroflexota bacterium]